MENWGYPAGLFRRVAVAVDSHVACCSMFTGLVESLGRVAAFVAEPPGVRLIVEAAEIAADARLGDSICVSGCCLSVVRNENGALHFQLGPETLSRTTLGGLAAGAAVNLERSLAGPRI